MTDLAIQLTEKSNKCLYQQIYEYIRNEIRGGKLLAGERLPSTRSLADHLQVARSTVDYAYGQLVAEGYLEAKSQRGYFVSHVEDLLELSTVYGQGQPRLSGQKPAGSTAAGKPSSEKPVSGPLVSGLAAGREEARIRYDFSPHAISLKHFPFSTWKKITRNILVDANSEMFARGDSQGDYSLRETIGRYLHSSRGVNCSPEQIIVGAGTDYLFLLLEKILGRHVPIAMEEPTYERAYQIFRSFAYEILAVPVDQSGMSVKELKKTNARLAYVMPSHQYPTGVVMPIGRRMELLRWAKEGQGRYLIEDDYDSEFRYRGKPIPSLQASDQAGRVIYMGTFSKSIAPAIRAGYMVLPESLLKAYRENCGCYASTVSRIDQRILDEFIKDGYFERYLNKMRKIYRERHDYLLGLLSPFSGGFRIFGENAGLHLLLTSKKGVPEKELVKSAEAEGVRIYGMSKACMQGRGADAFFRNTILAGYGGVEMEELEEGVGRLKKAWREYM